uniref:Uncharacterized protein n=1 Tax=Anopheles arabiensis TaxID=7173 RepID=A0A182IH13_ANOAR
MQIILMPGRYQYSCYFYYRLSVRLGTRNRSDLCPSKIRTQTHTHCTDSIRSNFRCGNVWI